MNCDLAARQGERIGCLVLNDIEFPGEVGLTANIGDAAADRPDPADIVPVSRQLRFGQNLLIGL